MTHISFMFRLLSPLVLLGPLCFGQYQFAINDASEKYNAEITVEECTNDGCRGKGSVVLFDKSGNKKQTFLSPDLVFYFKKDFKPSKEIMTVTQDMFRDEPLYFDDFNFDGTQDVSVRNGNGGNYGSASYDIYVFNSTKMQFVPSAELTELASGYQGMFGIDEKNKRLTTFARSGQTYYTNTYEVVPGKGVVLVSEKIEDHTTERAKIIIKKKVNNKWVVKKTTE
ncbi:XAC2610-related protein [Chryseobacterium sp.]|jgi:hypothetical protein|uniref:XAC2610-related protein n=1 Tax=Chryseobacterium sp. TaxID=1871047 RepID=UPI0028528534|nr:hypothetical protein [Chryseobacterium sp.]